MSLRTPFCTDKKVQEAEAGLGRAQAEASRLGVIASTRASEARRNPSLSPGAAESRGAYAQAVQKCRELQDELLHASLMAEAGIDTRLTLRRAESGTVEVFGSRLSSPRRSNLWVQSGPTAPLVRAIVENGQEDACIREKRYRLVAPNGSPVPARGERRDAWIEWLATP